MLRRGSVLPLLWQATRQLPRILRSRPSTPRYVLARSYQDGPIYKETNSERDNFSERRTPKVRPYRPKMPSERFRQEMVQERDPDSSARKKTEGDMSKDSEWSETFGTLSKEINQPADWEEEEDSLHDAEKSRRKRRDRVVHPPIWYSKQIKKLASEGKIYEAIEFMEERMMKTDRVQPNTLVFATLIGVLGRVGYTKKAFELLDQMKTLGLEPIDHIYTSLFNACSKCLDREEGLRQAVGLQAQLEEQKYEISQITYNSIMKVHAYHGQRLAAFQVAERMAQAGHRLDDWSYTALLQSCRRDKQSGLKYAIEVWRGMKKRRLPRILQHYTLLLVAVRDCGLGSPKLARQLLTDGEQIEQQRHHQHMPALEPGIQPDSEVLAADGEQNYGANSDSDSTQVVPVQSAWTEGLKENEISIQTTANSIRQPGGISALDMDVPSILSPRGMSGDVLGIANLDTPAKRLALLGGVAGILRHMDRDKLQPNAQILTLLLDMVPQNVEAEADLMCLLKVRNIKPTVFFFNSLIRRRSSRGDVAAAKETLEIMSRLEVLPDVDSFFHLAKCCRERADGMQLLTDMEMAGTIPDSRICSLLMTQARFDFPYKTEICKYMTRLNIQPNEHFLTFTEVAISSGKKLIVLDERGVRVKPQYRTSEFKKQYHTFVQFYSGWLRSTTFEKTEHPWEKFERPSIETLEERAREDADAL